MPGLPKNVHLSTHPCVAAKLSKLRSSTTSPRDTKTLIHDIGMMLATEALSRSEILTTAIDGKDTSHLGRRFKKHVVSPSNIVIVPILRSGLGMVDAVQTILPDPVPVHHLGMFRGMDLQAIEYYNRLPGREDHSVPPCDIAIIVDPIIATGGTMKAAIQTLRQWGVPKMIVVSVLGSYKGLRTVATDDCDDNVGYGGDIGGGGDEEDDDEGEDVGVDENIDGDKDVDIFVGAVDMRLKDGMIVPGVGDIGDRLFLTGKN